MEMTKTNSSDAQYALAVAFFVLIATWGIFYLDHETKSVSQLFDTGNLVALVIYFLPTFFISFFLYNIFSRKKTKRKSLILSLLTGIPLGFILVMIILLKVWR